jgi:heme a synthase
MDGFRRLTISTLIAVYLLILVGGVVRSTGSGMGCPDWPKCFGSWVPPTSVSQLPENYKEIYAGFRQRKNERFARVLTAMGMRETADAITNDPGVLIENDFNVTKTWIEYFNRIVGVVIGMLIIAVFVFSIRFWSSRRNLTLISLSSLVLVIFQGWIGSLVVSTNLTPWTITLHMFLALLQVALLVYLVNATGENEKKIRSSLGFWWLVASMALLGVQILLGTQVREAIDSVALLTTRDKWIESILETFVIHRSFTWLILLVHIAFIVRLGKTNGFGVFPMTLIGLLISTIISGAGMAYFGVPPFLQPIHLLLATLTFGMQFLFLLKLNRKEEVQLSTK